MDKTRIASRNDLCLRFISGRYEGGEFPLKTDSEILIGRSDEADVFIDEDLVSRKHAMISQNNENLLIRDLGSTNGTFVNGIQVSESKLLTGDRILIGGSIMRISPCCQQTMKSDLNPEQIRQMMECAAEQKEKSAIFEGSIEDVPLADLIQMLSCNQKSGLLRISGNPGGGIRIRDGEIWDAFIENLDIKPMKAWCRILSWQNGRFKLEADNESDIAERRLEGATQALILEGFRQADEMNKLLEELPDASQSLCLCRPLNAPLKDLEPNMLVVIQAIHNYGTIEETLNHIPASDFKILSTIKFLWENNYLTVKKD